MAAKTYLKNTLAISIFFVVLTFAGTVQAKIIYVDDNAPGLNDGSSWADAYNYLQDALATVSNVDEILVAQGFYKPDQGVGIISGDRTATFQLINGITLKGGYAGFGEPDPNALDIHKYKSILSGDLSGDDVEVNDPCDLLIEPTLSENSYHVVTSSRTDVTTILDGFTITGGNAGIGGGMYNETYGNPTVTNCTFSRNIGGGMCNEDSSPTITSCTFNGNSAEKYGGGMFNYSCSPTVTNCTFSGNSASIYGGGMYNEENSYPTITNCTFSGNSARFSGGGMCNFEVSDAMLINCTFSGNSAGFGGGMNNTDSSPTVTNCTFSGNSAGLGGGVYNENYSNATITNCILRHNTALSGAQIYNDDSTPVITYSNVQGSWPGDGNIDVDPLFADPNSNDYHLKSQAGRYDPNSQTWAKDDETSSCIDAGDPMNPIMHEPFPNGGRINMGAFGGTPYTSKSYFGKPVCETIVAGDINGDCKVDFKDFVIMARNWLRDHSK